MFKYYVFVIPSGALCGSESSATLKSNIDQFVALGGTLIIFLEKHGSEYNSLPIPGQEIAGYSWLEDQNSTIESVDIRSSHPILSAQDSPTLNLNIGGYFTEWPENDRVLLTATENGMPVMIVYEHGRGTPCDVLGGNCPGGTVIATTALTDWAADHDQVTQDGVKLVRDMLAWATNWWGEIPEFSSADTVNIPIVVPNHNLFMPEEGYPSFSLGDTIMIPTEIENYAYLEQPSDRVVFTVFDPEGVWEEFEIPVSISSGDTATIDFAYQTTESSKVGQYFYWYDLYDGETIIRSALGSDFFMGVNSSHVSTYVVDFVLRDPDRNIVHEESQTILVQPQGTETINYSYSDPSELGIWSLEINIWDWQEELQRKGVMRFSVNNQP